MVGLRKNLDRKNLSSMDFNRIIITHFSAVLQRGTSDEMYCDFFFVRTAILTFYCCSSI